MASGPVLPKVQRFSPGASGRSRLVLGALGALLAAELAGCGPGPPSGSTPAVISPTISAIRRRGHLNCGVEGTMPGFSRMDPSGRYSGFDVDLCRAVAAALLGDGTRVRFRNLTAPERFVAIASGEVDLLARNTTWTLSRDASGGNGLSFAPIVVHDGQGFLVPAASGYRDPAELRGRPICVVSGTTTELNLADWMRRRALPYTPLKFQSHDQSFAAYLQGRCGAITSSLALLAARRSTFPDPTGHVLLKAVISQEPIAPATCQDDPVWSDAVRWIVFALIEAEDLDIRQATLDSWIRTALEDPRRSRLRRFLGVEGELGARLGLPRDFTVRLIRAVGHYGEIHGRNLGADSPLRLERGRDRLWHAGGLLWSPPFE
jgi:general L-amino acid transport system substrate-binding protein